ncbi:hypothetical protein VPNG_01207 [Cytospora leucostoma]|uniref:CorA-like transporter domain-containing protein n=1 Tax=Cytospora leucostoma TaxID=1230097 RepID=A0A423XL73_9PEZI|nr:hypothetical protein VPNG_01207 [Cytospora leucostoma]
MGTHMLDQLNEACEQADTWPLNLIRKQHLNRVLDNWRKRLHADEGRLFVPKDAKGQVKFWETFSGQDSFNETPLCDRGELIEHFDRHLRQCVKDPRSRHVFITAAHSRAALQCTPQMFRYICSYQQISPIFVDMLASFGKQYRKLDFHSAAFSQDDLHNPEAGTEIHIAEIGRSDWHLRHCYKLHGMEISDFDQKWTMRQTAVYHSFDMQEGRAFWLTVKANDEIMERVKDGSKSLEALKASNLNSLGLSFISCLKTHMITLDWCAEGWRWQIGAIETGVREVLVRVKNTPIEPLAKELEFTPELLKSLSFKTTQGTQFPSPTRQNTSQTLNTLAGRVRVAISARKETAAKSENERLQVMPHQDREADQEKEEEMARQLDGLVAFSFSESQRLTSFATTLQETKLAMTLNIGVLRDLREYYEGLFSSSRVPHEIMFECERRDAFNEFVRRVKSLEGQLETECRRAETLILMIEDGKCQYDSILQSYNMEINKLFALSNHKTSKRMEGSSKRMEIVAQQTARDSASMHVITFLTMVFLPGTFVGHAGPQR